MKKWLKNLLFEEDGEEEIEVIPEKPQNIRQETLVKEEVKPVKKFEFINQEEPTINVSRNFFVDEPTTTKQEPVMFFNTTTQPSDEPQFYKKLDAINEIEQPKIEKPKIGIDIEEVTLRPRQKKPSSITNSKYKQTTPYERTPVISPMFGISDKDAESVIPTSPKKAKISLESGKGSIISPMYGLNQASDVVVEKQPSTKVTTPIVETASKPISNQEAQVNYSLDDILARTKVISDTSMDSNMFASEILDTKSKKVITSRNLSLFDDEE